MTSVSVGMSHACAVTESGAGFCWGSQTWGGVASDAGVGRLPFRVRAVGAGYVSSCAVVEDGGVACWGQNASAQLGDNTTATSTTPVIAAVSVPVEGFSVGGFHVCAVADGGVLCWGSNYSSESGGPANNLTRIPTAIAGATNVRSISGGSSTTFAVLDDGGVLVWGYDLTTASSPAPRPLHLSGAARAMTVNWYHACAVLQSGALECFGRAFEGQLGFDAGSTFLLHGQVPGVRDVVAACAGMKHSCAVFGDGGVACWGDNTWGQLGTGNYSPSPGPAPVVNVPPTVAISCEEKVTCAVTTQGLYCWGDNSMGQFGTPTPPSSNQPVRVPVP